MNENRSTQKYLPYSIFNVFSFGSGTKTCNQHKEKNSNVFTIYKESLLCENSTYKYDLYKQNKYVNYQCSLSFFFYC